MGTMVAKDQELEAAFRRSAEEGLVLLHRDHAAPIARYIKSLTRGLLSADELKDVVQETFLNLLEAARRPSFDPRQPQRLAFHIAKARAFHALRRRREAVAWREVGETASFEASRAFLQACEKGELREALSAICEALPPRQKLIATVFIDNIAALRRKGRYLFIADEVERLQGERLSARAIKSAWTEARKKILAGLRQRGFSLSTRD